MSSNLKHILFATDGSDFSSGAQRVAVDLAKRCGARLTVMTIVLTTQDLEGVGTHGLREQMEREAQARIDTVVAAAKSAGVACDTQLVYGEEPHHEIVNTAAELKPDLVVLGRRGKRGLARLMVGHATDLELDGHGRILVPPELREFASLGRAGMLIGQGNRFELWDETRWNARRDQWLESDETTTDLPSELDSLTF